MKNTGYPAIFDFALFPYALGDVLTWNVQTTIRSIQLGMEHVDIYMCVDRERPASIFQQGLIHPGNYQLHFHELLPAFNTHPKLRHLKIYADRETMLRELKSAEGFSPSVLADIRQYEETIAPNVSEDERTAYFLKFIQSHKQLNDWSKDHGSIPMLTAPPGYKEDLQYLQRTHFRGRRPVAVHFRLRRLDMGMGGEHTYERDADFTEWYDFLRKAAETHPEVHFIMMGRLPEKPLAILRLPNVTSLRTLGMNLGHELALIAGCDLFLGSSSGFAAMANFTEVPYFITKMGKSPCDAYEIPLGEKRLPFALPAQHLVYEVETSELLMSLLEQGLRLPSRQKTAPNAPGEPVVIPPTDNALKDEHQNLMLAGASTHRYYADDVQCDSEVLHLLQRDFDLTGEDIKNKRWTAATERLCRARLHFPRAVIRSPRYHALCAEVAGKEKRQSDADMHRVWCALLETAPDRRLPEKIELAMMRQPLIYSKIGRRLLHGEVSVVAKALGWIRSLFRR